jgi:hypothetical protein
MLLIVIPAKRGPFRPNAEPGPSARLGEAALLNMEPSALTCWVPDHALAGARAVRDDCPYRSVA